MVASAHNSQFSQNISTNTDHITKLFDNYVLIDDFNMEPNNTILKHFLDSNVLVK